MISEHGRKPGLYGISRMVRGTVPLTYPPAPFLSRTAGEEGGGCILTFALGRSLSP